MINGVGNRKCTSWIESFVEHTANLESPEIWRKWSAISMIAAVLEQKVWLDSGGQLFPNLYTFLVGDPGLGKSRAIMAASNIVREHIPDIHFGATSMTRASMADYMVDAKRFIANIPHAPIEYNSLVAVADEFSAFMHEYDSALVAALVEFYDVNPYSEGRRVTNIRIKIPRPQLNILTGSTPSNLLHTLKDYVWDQGLMSRVMMIYARERPVIDTFNTPPPAKPVDLIHDIKIIWTLFGPFAFSSAFAKAMNDWKTLGQIPVPTHPKLVHYNSRRFAHMLKLSMIASVDRSNELKLDVQDFNKAMGWLLEAENLMQSIFEIGSVAPDSRVMDEVVHFIKQFPGAVPEHRVINFLRGKVGSHLVGYIMQTMIASRMIVARDIDEKGLRKFTAG
jgi:hypothetical protein